MSASAFLDILEKQALLDDKVIKRLREQVASSPKAIGAEKVAKLLIGKGHLTKFQAQKLLDAAAKAAPAADEDDEDVVMLEAVAPGPSDDGGLAPLDDDDGGLAPLDDGGLAPLDDGGLAPLQDDGGLAPLDDDGGLAPLDDGGLAPLDDGGLAPLDEGGLEPLDAGGLEPLDAGGLEPLDAGGLEPLDAGGLEPLDPNATQPLGMEATIDGGLEPLGAGGLEPLDAGGLEPLDAGGLEPLGGGGLDALDDTPAPAAAGKLPDEPEPEPAEEDEDDGKKKKKKKGFVAKKKKLGNQWDTPLILLGGGGLVLLFIIGAYLYFALMTTPARELLEQADTEYSEGAYSQAVERYSEYISKHSGDTKTGYAKCKRGLSEIRAVLSGNPLKAQETIETVLEDIKTEKEFGETCRNELGSILPDQAAKFATRAKTAGSVAEAEDHLANAERAMQLVRNPEFLPRSILDLPGVQKKIDAVVEDIGIAKRNIARDRELEKAIAAIQEAVDKDDTQGAFAVRAALLKDYPSLELHEKLLAAILGISDKERQLVKEVAESIDPITTDEKPAGQVSVVLASRTGKVAEGITNRAVHYLADGGVYGIDASTGNILWRRFVGYETVQQPVMLSKQAGSDVLVMDARKQELIRLKALTGEVVWRVPVGDEFADPVLVSDRILVATRSGKLLEVQAESGAVARHGSFPQELTAGPAVDTRRPLMYQAGGHSNIYVLSSESFECKEVFYLGHKLGSISVPPVLASGYVLVAENVSADFSKLHIFETNSQGMELAKAMTELRLKGRIVVPPIAYGRRVVVMTDLGELHVLDVDPSTPDKPVTDAVASVVATFDKSITGQAALDRGQLYVVDNKLMKYEIQTSRQKLFAAMTKYTDDVFRGNVYIHGDYVYYMRQHSGTSGLSVEAAKVDGGDVVWKTDLAVPPAQVVTDPSQNRIEAVTAQGELFAINGDALRKGLVEAPNAVADPNGKGNRYTRSTSLGGGKYLFTSEVSADRMVLLEPTSGTSRMTPISLRSYGNLTCKPVPFAGGFIAPVSKGQIYLLKSERGAQSLVREFQPRLQPGQRVKWRLPAVIDGDSESFVIADDQRNIFLIGVQRGGTPHLKKINSSPTEFDIQHPLAAIGDTVLAISRGAGGDSVIKFSAKDLSVDSSERSLEGRVTMGPVRFGDQILVVTSQDGIVCFGEGGKELWSQPVPYGSLTGLPARVDNDYIFASIDGMVWRVSGENGQEIGKVELSEPLDAAPVTYGDKRIILTGSDGTLHIIGMIKGS